MTRPAAVDAARLVPPAGGLAVLACSTAMVGLLDGLRWLGFVAVAVAVVVAAGMLLRAGRVPGPLVPLCQVIALILLVTALFTRDGILGVLPGPQAWASMRDLLSDAGAQIQVGVAPIPVSPEILLLITATFGVAAILIDLIAVGLQAPAVCGLVLLCVFAVPASLTEGLLPWWTFTVAAASFALLLVLDRRGRQLSWRDAHSPGSTGGTTAPRAEVAAGPRPAVTGAAGPAALTVAAVAVVMALVVGAGVTVVGTAGRLPGGAGSSGGGQIGLTPFTALRGQLQDRGEAKLFEVTGLPQPAYLRALTLDQYVPQQGWRASPERAGAPLTGRLPTPAAVGDTPESTIEVNNTGYRDSWLPLYPTPLAVQGVLADRWSYDPATGVAYTREPGGRPIGRSRRRFPTRVRTSCGPPARLARTIPTPTSKVSRRR